MEDKTRALNEKGLKKNNGKKNGAIMGGVAAAGATVGVAGTAFAMSGNQSDVAEAETEEPMAQQETTREPAAETPARQAKPAAKTDAHHETPADTQADVTPEGEAAHEEDAPEVPVEEVIEEEEYVIDENEEFAGIDDIDPDKVVEEIEIDEVPDITPAGEFAANEAEDEIYTINGETLTTGTLVDEDGNEYVVIDINGDGIYDEYVTADGISHDIDFVVPDPGSVTIYNDETAAHIEDVDTGIDPAGETLDDSADFSLM